MSKELAELLLEHGPQLSGPLCGLLAQKKGLSADAARQRLARRRSPVKFLTLPFAKRARFFYVDSQFGSPQFWTRLSEALESNGGAYSRLIKALNARGGIIPLSHLAAAAATSADRKQIAAPEMVERLVEVRLVEEITLPGIGPCLAYAKGASYIDELVPDAKARLVCESVLLESVKDWAAKLGLGSYGSFMLRGESQSAPMVSKFAWDMTAPSYLAHLADWSDKPKPGFLAVDVLLKQHVELADVQPFLYKCTSLRKVSRARCLYIFIAHRYSLEALNALRAAGIVPATVVSLFGKEVAEALLTLASVLREAAGTVKDVEKFELLFTTLGRSEGAAGRLRGALFEFIVAAVVRIQKGDAVPDMNKIYREQGKDVAEVDVRSIANGTGRFIECKGLLPGHLLDDAEVDKWLKRRIPVVRKHTVANPEWANLKCVFEMWLTGELSQTGKSLVEEAKKAASEGKKQTIEVYGPREIEEMIENTGDKNLLKVFRDHFLNAPLANLAELGNPVSKRRINQFDRAPLTGNSGADNNRHSQEENTPGHSI